MAKTLEEIRQSAIDNEVKGKKFSTIAKLLNNIQIEKHDGSKYKKDIKLVECVLDYKKTGKINPKTHKMSNEIIVTDIFDEVKQYKDNRYSEVSNYIYILVKSLNSYSYTAEASAASLKSTNSTIAISAASPARKPVLRIRRYPPGRS